MKNLILAVTFFLVIAAYAQDSTAKVKMDSTKYDPITIVSNKPNLDKPEPNRNNFVTFPYGTIDNDPPQAYCRHTELS